MCILQASSTLSRIPYTIITEVTEVLHTKYHSHFQSSEQSYVCTLPRYVCKMYSQSYEVVIYFAVN
jgi:hypothetical protein